MKSVHLYDYLYTFAMYECVVKLNYAVEGGEDVADSLASVAASVSLRLLHLSSVPSLLVA